MSDLDAHVIETEHTWRYMEGKDARFRPILVPPLTSLADAPDEIRWAKEHGVAGVFMRAVEGDRILHDPYLLERNRFYVACQTDDDLEYVMRFVGEDNLLIGTDYGHNDQASELGALRALKSNGKINERQYRKITDDNAAAFYGL